MLESLNFNFDGVDSTDYPIVNINIGNGLFTEQFMSQRSIIEVIARGNDKPYFQGVTRQPLTFPLSFYFTDVWDEDMIREIVRWLDVDYYRPFYFTDSPDRIYYCIPTDTPQILHNGLKQGYVTINMRCDSPYVYSPTILSELYEFIDDEDMLYNDATLSNDTLYFDDTHTFDDTNDSSVFFDYTLGINHIASTGTELTLNIDSDFNVYPEMWISKVGDGDITIINMTNGGSVFQFTGLVDGETIYIDNEQECIESDTGLYRFDNFNDNYLEFIYGNNILNINGNCEIQFKYSFKYKNAIL